VLVLALALVTLQAVVDVVDERYVSVGYVVGMDEARWSYAACMPAEESTVEYG
jgi:hypothetical protein